MRLNDWQEVFSKAFIGLICASAGYPTALATREEDSRGVDLRILDKKDRSTFILVQAKCALSKSTTVNIKKDKIVYKLDAKNYNRLIERSITGRYILILVVVPDLPKDWLKLSEDCLTAYKCAYWKSLEGCEKKENASTVSIDIPKANLLTKEAIESLMEGVKKQIRSFEEFLEGVE